MAPRKKTPTMIWVKKAQQPANMAKPATEKKSLLDCSLLRQELPHSSDSVSILQLSSSATKEDTLSMPGWSLLPEELLHIISEKLECFDVIHARSVCRLWRSIFPFPSSLLRTRYSLPSFAKFPRKSKRFCTLEKFPMFLFRVKIPSVAADVLTSEYFWGGMAANVSTSEYFLGGIGRYKSKDQMELSSPIQCSVKVNIPRTDPTLMNMNDCQILPLGHQYRMIGWNPESWLTGYRGVAFLALNKEKGVGEKFVVLLNYNKVLLGLRSAEMRWMRVKETSIACCSEVIAFRGRFYATFLGGDISVYDPYTLIGTPLMPSQPLNGWKYLVQSGDDELLLVELFNPYPEAEVLNINRFACRVSMLDEETGKWVEVSDLGDRVFFIGHYGNVSCSAKEIPSGCGVSGNSIVFTNRGPVAYAYKYGVETGQEEDELNFWRILRENRVNCLMTSPVVADGEDRRKQLSTSPVLVLRVEV